MLNIFLTFLTLLILFPVHIQAYFDPSLGCNIITDTTPRTRTIGYPITTPPPYLTPYIDSNFGAKITRITSDDWVSTPYSEGNTDTFCRHHYSKDQAWNADGSIILLNKGCAHTGGAKFIDGNTYLEKTPKMTSPTSQARWHPTDAHVLIYIKNNKLTKRLYSADYKSYVDSVYATFTAPTGTPAYVNLGFGHNEGNLSHSGNMVVLDENNGTNSGRAFAYNMATNTKYPDKLLTQGFGSTTISPSGEYIVYFSGSFGNYHTHIYKYNDWTPVTVFNEKECPSHYDLTYNNLGEEVAVGACKTSPSAYPDASGHLVSRRLIDGQLTQLGDGASHTSARNITPQRKGWVYTSGGTYSTLYQNEILSKNFDAVIERLAYIPGDPAPYEGEAHASASPDGKKVIVASNWGDASKTPHSYIIELCPGNVVPTGISPTLIQTITPSSIPCAMRSKGDANCDQQVDPLDFDIYRLAMNGTLPTCTNCSVDFNADGKISIVDYEIWRNTFYK